MTSQRVRIPCPQCGRPLRIRVENLGRRGICKHCDHKFRAGVDGAEVSVSPQRGTGTSGAKGKPRRSRKLELRMGVLESELRAVLSHLADQSAQHASVLQELDTTRRRLAEVQAARQHKQDHDQDADPTDEETAESETEAEEEAELTALRDRARDAGRLEEELRAERTRAELLRAQILEIESRGGVLAFHEGDRPRVDAEPEGDSEVLAPGTPAAAWPGQREDEVTPGDERFEAERSALAHEIDRLRSKLGDVEPALEAALARIDHERAAWEDERRELEARWEEHHQAALAEAQAEAHARVRAELRDSGQDATEGDGDSDGDGQRLTAEREALKRVVRRLRKRLVVREQARAELVQALAQARERWDAERQEWQDQGAEASQALQRELETAGSQLAELKRHAQAIARERDALATRLELAETLNDDDEGHAEILRAELESLRATLLRAEQEHAQALETLRAEHEVEHLQWTECSERLLRETEDARAELKQQAEAAAHERDELIARLERAEAQHELDGRETETLRAEIAALQSDRQRAEQEHLQALESLRTELEDERRRFAERAEQDHGHALATLRAELDRRHAAEVSALRAEFDEERRRGSDSTEAAHAQTLEALRGELKREHAEELVALRGALEQEHAQALEDLRTEFDHQQDRDGVNTEQERAQALAALQAGHEGERRRWTEQVERLEQDLVAARAELSQQAEAVARQHDELEELATRLEQGGEPHAFNGREGETLRAELESLRQKHQRAEQEHAQALEALRGELDQERERAQTLDSMRAEFEDERRQWTERAGQLQAALDAAQRDRNNALQEIERLADQDRPVEPDRQSPPPPQADSETYRQTIQRLAGVLAELSNKQILTNQRKAELISQVMTLRNTLARLTTAARGELVVRPRPRSESFADAAEYRADLSRWLNEAQQRRQQAGTQMTQLESELDSGRRELDLLNRDLALGTWDLDEEDEEDAEIAYPFEAD